MQNIKRFKLNFLSASAQDFRYANASTWKVPVDKSASALNVFTALKIAALCFNVATPTTAKYSTP
jgi:hypothetical protein